MSNVESVAMWGWRAIAVLILGLLWCASSMAVFVCFSTPTHPGFLVMSLGGVVGAPHVWLALCLSPFAISTLHLPE